MRDQHIDRVCRLRFGQQHLLYVDQWVLQHGGDIQALEIASEALLSEVWFRSLPQLVQHIRSGCAWRIFVESDRVFWCANGVEKNRDLEWRGKLASFELLEKGCVLVDIYLLTVQWNSDESRDFSFVTVCIYSKVYSTDRQFTKEPSTRPGNSYCACPQCRNSTVLPSSVRNKVPLPSGLPFWRAMYS